MNDMLKTTPDFSTEAAAALLKEHYGLSATLSLLASERDQNFKVEAEDGSISIPQVLQPYLPGLTRIERAS